MGDVIVQKDVVILDAARADKEGAMLGRHCGV